jgi:hypothetical protein
MTKEEGQDRKKQYELNDEMQEKAEDFSKRFASAIYEMGQAQQFMRNFCEVFGIDTYSSIQFEERVRKEDDTGINRIDGFLPGMLLIEMKSGGKDLAKAAGQAFGYMRRLEVERPKDVPDYVMVSDFKSIVLYDKRISETEPAATISLPEFANSLDTFLFLNSYKYIVERRQEEVNILAAEKLAALHDVVKATGYTGKDLETLLVRILFCLFAEDTGLFAEPDQFTKLVNDTHTDGRDLSGALDLLFLSLDAAQRPDSVYPSLRLFPYVNGELFKGRLAPCYFTSESRTALLSCAADLDWSQISPAIFGSLFQFIMHFDVDDIATKSKKRREFGAHYTSEKNILKTIRPLFLDQLKKELKSCKGDAKKLEAFLAKLRCLRIFDPACGCGNFLVVAYREIRLLEEQALNEVKKGQMSLDMPLCNVNQFFGIEIDPSAAQIATLALWLTDHQMNMRVRQPDGKPYIRLPLTAKANIFCGNALQLDWNSVIKSEECSYIVGNPPFVGKKEQNAEQKTDMALVFKDIDGAGVLDYVTGWYVKAVTFIKENPAITAAFVSTNSITQGEQVGVLWSWMLQQGVQIHFAHRTFRWSNEGKGVAAVHCVIIGFGLDKPKKREIFDYPDINGVPQTIKAKNINPYLVDAPNVVIPTRRTPLCNAPEMIKGNEATDGGYLVLDMDKKEKLLAECPLAECWISSFLGGDDFLNGGKRWCLWLKGFDPGLLHLFPPIQERVEKVRSFRLASPKQATVGKAAVPWLFGEDRQPTAGNYIVIPKVSSERREYMPLGFESYQTIINNTLQFVPNGTLYDFGVLSSVMHMAWMKTTCGRMKSDYQYSINVVYNNFSWPEKLTVEQQQAVTDKAQKVLDVRKNHNGQTLAWMYNPETMPDDLKKAHAGLDAAVDAAYGYTGGKDDAERVAFLFGLYGEYLRREMTKIDR